MVTHVLAAGFRLWPRGWLSAVFKRAANAAVAQGASVCLSVCLSVCHMC